MANVTIHELEDLGQNIQTADELAIYHGSATYRASVDSLVNASTLASTVSNISNTVNGISSTIGTGSLEIGDDIIDAINKLNTSYSLFIKPTNSIGSATVGTVYLCTYNQQEEVYLNVYNSNISPSETVSVPPILSGEFFVYIPSFPHLSGSLTLNGSTNILEDPFKIVFVPHPLFSSAISYEGDYESCTHMPDLTSSPANGIVVNGNVGVTLNV